MHKMSVSGITWQADYTHSYHLDWGLGCVCPLGKAIPLEISKALRNQTLSLMEICSFECFHRAGESGVEKIRRWLWATVSRLKARRGKRFSGHFSGKSDYFIKIGKEEEFQDKCSTKE